MTSFKLTFCKPAFLKRVFRRMGSVKPEACGPAPCRTVFSSMNVCRPAFCGRSITKGSLRRKHDSDAYKGEITIFFALCTAIIIALMLSLLESARTAGGRLYMTAAANSSIDSLFSQYHRMLWEEYRILGLEYYAYEQITDEMSAFIKPYFEADTWFPMKTDRIEISDLRLITEDEGIYYENEVLDYMKYGIAASVWDTAQAILFSEGVTEGGSVCNVSDIYDGHTREAVKLEEALEKLGDCIAAQEEHYNRACSAVDSFDGDGFIREAIDIIHELKRIPGLVDDYQKRAGAMEEGLAQSRRRLEEEKTSGNISDSVWNSLNEDITEYESYVSEDGERRKEIAGFAERSTADAAYLEGLITEAESIMEYIASWEPEDEDDELNEAELWDPVITAMQAYDLIRLGVKYGIEDKETEKQLEDIMTLLKGNILKLVIPQGAVISNEKLDFGEKPSETYSSGENIVNAEFTDSLYIAEYIAEVTDYFGRGKYDAGSVRTGSGALETEYVIFGHDNDVSNLTASVERLTGIRTGLNLAYLYADSTRKNEARMLAMQITGSVGLAPLVPVVTFFILSVWALAQAVCDVRDLLAGRKVPFMHSSASFYLTIPGLLQLISGQLPESGSRDSGLKYSDYLRILLFFGHGSLQDYRCMDVMQMCIRKKQKDFRMDRVVYSLNADVYVRTAHLFTALGIVKNQGIDIDNSYSMHVSTAYSY